MRTYLELLVLSFKLMPLGILAAWLCGGATGRAARVDMDQRTRMSSDQKLSLTIRSAASNRPVTNGRRDRRGTRPAATDENALQPAR